MRRLVVLITLSAVLVGCKGDFGADPTLLNEGFKGITYTNNIGEVIGIPDNTDWSKLTNADSENCTSNHCEVLVSPAYPNPTSRTFQIRISTQSHASFSLALIDSDMNVLKSLGGTFLDGVRTLEFDISNLSPGIYRLKFEIGGYKGKGDIWLK